IRLFRLAQAGERRPAVDEHQAAAARTLGGAAVLGGCDTAILAQHVQQVHAGLVRGFGGGAVQCEVDLRHRGLLRLGDRNIARLHPSGRTVQGPRASARARGPVFGLSRGPRGGYMQEPWKTDKWFASPWCYLPEVRQNLGFGSNLKIHDVTLRDGEQQTAVVFRREEKVAIAKKLDSLGIHRIEAGMPAVSDQDKAAISDIAAL